MKVLLVDDQKSIVDNLREKIPWDTVKIDQVYTACSAREARLLLKNFDIDILITDIEMPEEDGLSLVAWVRENDMAVECIFLTAHADFEYAREAVHLGSFEYILQPVRYDDVVDVVSRVVEKVSKRQKFYRIESVRKNILEQRDILLDAIMFKIMQEDKKEADRLFTHLTKLLQVDFEPCVYYPMLVEVTRWKHIAKTWDEKLVRLVLKNVLEELFCEIHACICVGCYENTHFLVLMAAAQSVSEDKFYRQIQDFYAFINVHMDFSIAVYPWDDCVEESLFDICRQLWNRQRENSHHKDGIYWDSNMESELPRENEEDAVLQGIAYIRKNISKNLSRSDVASYVHLSEVYFSRLFRQKTGTTYKEYIVSEKMKTAARLLERTNLSVSIIASKVGYDNFSHFSKSFKKIIGCTPQEYRKGIHQ